MGLDRVERALHWRGPSERLGAERPGQREVAFAADDEGRLRDKPPRGRRKAVNAVLADADNGEPPIPTHGAAP